MIKKENVISDIVVIELKDYFELYAGTSWQIGQMISSTMFMWSHGKFTYMLRILFCNYTDL